MTSTEAERGTAGDRPIPVLDDLTRPFWTGGADGVLLIAQCGGCGTWLHPPRPRCPLCGSRSVTPEPVSGRGTVFSFTINHQAWQPGLDVPYVIALVELAEQPGLRLTTNIVGTDRMDVAIDREVEVEFLDHSPVFVPVFHLVAPLSEGISS